MEKKKIMNEKDETKDRFSVCVCVKLVKYLNDWSSKIITIINE